MAAGFSYNLNSEPVIEELCRFETVFRHSGGFNLVVDGLPNGSIVPVLCPLSVDFKTRKATVVKNIKLTADATATDTQYKIAKGSFAYIGMFIGTGTKGAKITAIDTSNADYDIITVDATLAVALKADQVLFEASAAAGTTPKSVANKLNYARTKVEAGATVTAIGKVYEIYEHKLHVPISDKDKTSLGDLFMFVY